MSLSKSEEAKLKQSPEAWAEYEYRNNYQFWIDAQINGNGLISKLADFVVLHGSGKHAAK